MQNGNKYLYNYISSLYSSARNKIRNLSFISLSHLISSLYIGPSVQHEDDHLHMAPTSCNMEGSEPILYNESVKETARLWKNTGTYHIVVLKQPNRLHMRTDTKMKIT